MLTSADKYVTVTLLEEVHLAVDITGGMPFDNYKTFLFKQNFAINYVSTFSTSKLYLVSHHKKPISNVGSLWTSLDLEIWACFMFAILTIQILVIYINIHFNVRNVEASDILLRLSIGILEPHAIQWYKG